MTVYLYTGTPGSGKSLHMADEILWRSRMGRPTLCNFDVTVPSKYGTGNVHSLEKLSVAELERYSEDYFSSHEYREGAIRLYIDECQLLFNARSWNERGRDGWVRFFTQHRKLGFDVVLVCQFDSMIDKQIRSLVEYEVKHRKLNNFGPIGRFLSLFALSHPVVACITYWYPMKQRLGSEFLLGRKRLYSLYDTRRIF